MLITKNKFQVYYQTDLKTILCINVAFEKSRFLELENNENHPILFSPSRCQTDSPDEYKYFPNSNYYSYSYLNY